MISESQIEETLNELFDDIEFTKEPAGLYDPLRYMIAIGGKRLRPHLCLTTYSLFKDEFIPELLDPAVGLEIFHSFTLIHDDIMDKSDLRRGNATVWKKWSEDTAILSGDVMCIDSFRRMTKAPKDVMDQVLELFTTTAAQVCDGQQLDMDFEKVPQVRMEDYMKMIGLKTAALIACSAKMGAIIAGAEAPVCDNLYKFGYDLGLAFQIRDDYLDVYGDEKEFGKPIGGDIVNNKKSWLLTRAMEKCDALEAAGIISSARGKADLMQAMEMAADNDAEKAAKIDKVKEIYGDLGIDHDAEFQIVKLHAQAMEYAGMVGANKVRYEMLHRFADRLIGRKK